MTRFTCTLIMYHCLSITTKVTFPFVPYSCIQLLLMYINICWCLYVLVFVHYGTSLIDVRTNHTSSKLITNTIVLEDTVCLLIDIVFDYIKRFYASPIFIRKGTLFDCFVTCED